ncbi:flavin monoamine oxidase family protein [Streptomyces johnsoniae]|uniref:FAD-dependent oxidoreductase n=1 Tax=Streptomyces johnsoniae TaxID=3075532 RepID=A0ABU2SBX5_9ACTN|nr:FAD-dependent oxidoreductase [Streptomyces sp. DSM 41886]MDT0446477.1 FAD-dependent oxidoreductase [Streptomyces sp. DSM 41886]
MNAEEKLPTSPTAHAPSRRSVLTTAGAAALAAPLGMTALGSQARAASGTQAQADAVDVIVIGAGIAGVTTARELTAKGLSTLVLEARDRIGGRAWTSTFAGEQVEMGGTWVDQRQPNIWREVQRYGWDLTSDIIPTRAVAPTATGYLESTPTDVYNQQSQLITPLFDGSEQYFERPYEPLFREDLLADLDPLSMRDRLDQMRYSPDEEALISGGIGGLTGSASTIGLTTMAHWWALSGWTFDDYAATSTYRPVVGSTAMAQSILDDSTATLRLNSPVASVADNGTSVTVTTKSGETHTARAVVLAIPVNLWNSIDFAPSLPTEYTTLSTDGIGVRSSQKFIMHVRGANLDAFYAEAAPGAPVAMVIPFKERSDGNIMIGFSSNGSFDPSNRTRLQAELQPFCEGIEVVAVKAQHWGNDPYSAGGWAVRRPGLLTGPFRAVQQPQGRVVFAGSDIANGWAGFMDGAVESGFTASVQASQILGL